MSKKTVGLAILIILIAFSGCGGGTESIDSILDVKNPQIVKDVLAVSSHKRVRILWAKSTDANVIGYNVYRSSTTSGFTLIGSVGQTTAPYFQDEGEDTTGDGIPEGLANNITYFYKVTAFDRNGRETPLSLSTVVSATPGVLPNEIIDIQVNNVHAYAGKNEAFITWDRIEHPRVYGYNIYRSSSGTSFGFSLIGFVPTAINGFIDGGLSSSENHVYQVAPVVTELETIPGESITSGHLEGRKGESRSVRTQDTDSTIPKPPGSSPASPYSVQAQQVTFNSKTGILVQFTRPTSNTDGSIIADNDDLVSGAYLIYRSSRLYGNYTLVGIIENAGSTATSEFFDPFGTTADYYYVKIGDNFGNLSAQSDIASASGEVPPNTVKSLYAQGGFGFGTIKISWTELTNQRLDGYNIYRSKSLDNGYSSIAHNVVDENPDPDVFEFTDASSSLNLNQTYYYKVSASKNGLESALSAATGSKPGPANGILVLEGENAVKIDSNITGATKTARIPPTTIPQFYPPHWQWIGETLPAPFYGGGALKLMPQNAATSNIPNGERIDLQWQVDVQSLVDSAVGGAISVDVYLQTADDNTSGQFKILIDDKVINRNMAPGLEGTTYSGGSIVDTGFDGIQAEINFRDSTFSTPLQPTRRLIGSLRVDHLADYNVAASPFAGPETIYMSIVHSGPSGASSNFGNLRIDALILVVH